ncbi:MAG: TonB-dependent receptor [Burkholderiales bacterium]|nr:TonB-dependent receptor [Burkholderiales bacterium]
MIQHPPPFPCHAYRRHARSVAASVTCALACASALVTTAHASSDEEDELAQAYGDQPMVSIATGSRQPVSRAPSVATVITAADIQAMGATDLDEVMETIPGVHVARTSQVYSPSYVFRGVNVGYNPQVLMLINGIPVTSVFTGNRGNGWVGLPLDNVARIEVIRGPGSALYGADAAAGVINIITKTANDINGTTVGARTGSFHTNDAWALHGGQWGPFTVAGYVRVGSTAGANSTIQADTQTGLDTLLGTHASHAPGPVNNGRDNIDGSLDLSLDKWRWRLGLRDRDNVGSGAGVASALDPTGSSRMQSLSSDLSYENDHIAPNWAVAAQLSAMHYSEKSDLTLFPAGMNFGGPTFTDGMIGNPYKWERHHRLNASATYTGFEQHRTRLGWGAESAQIYKIRETKNFNPDFTPIGTGSRADIIDVSGTLPFLTPHSRQLQYVFGQDEWSLAKDWTLTAGLRHDHYSDFGTTTNPRLALVWDAAYNVTAKLMTGTAFRPPSFTELYAINNPVAQGNAQLKPEKTRTVEAAVSWQAAPQWQIGANVFHYRMDDIIQLVSFQYQNTGRLTGDGLELESSWTVNKTLRISGNCSYQFTEDGANQHDAGNAPHHQVYARADWRMLPNWSLHTQVNWISDQTRVHADTRANLPGYNTVDLTVRSEREGKGWNTSFSVRNALDAKVREPSVFDQSPGQPFISLPNDYPMPGRSFYVQGTYTF